MTEQPTPPTKTKQVPAWSLYLTIGIAVVLLCGGIATASASKPEPEVTTKMVTKEIKVEDTDKIDELETQLDVCKESTLLASQAMVDAVNAFVKVSEGASELNISKIEEASAIIQAMDAERVGTKAKECDSTIGSKITGLPE